MMDYREILRLRSLGFSQRHLEREKIVGREKSKEIFRAADRVGIHWPLDDDVTNEELELLLFPGKYSAVSMHVEPDYPYIHRELAKHGVTLTLLWEEYCRKCHCRRNINEDSFKAWAETVGPMAERVVEYFLSFGKAPEQGYKACASLTKLSKRYGNTRLESACERILAYSSTPSIRNLSSILRNGQDRIAPAKEPSASEPTDFGITRGAAYFRKGGERR